MQLHTPPHPGSILKEDVLTELGLTVTQAAAQLGVSRVQFSRFINGRSGVTPELVRTGLRRSRCTTASL